MKVLGYFQHMYRVENNQLKRYIESLTKTKTYANFHHCQLSDILKILQDSLRIDDDNT